MIPSKITEDNQVLLTDEIMSQNNIPYLVEKRRKIEKSKKHWISTHTRRSSLGLVL